MSPFDTYIQSARSALESLDRAKVEDLALALRAAWSEGRQVFLCGNGGSAANALHLANDLLYGVAKGGGRGLRVHALPANQAVMTCLANDVGYAAVFATQLEALARPGDLLVVLSGSGNSENVVEALRAAQRGGLETFAVLGFSGGRCLQLAQHVIHVPIDDMQISEDLQLVVGHMVVQWLAANPPVREPAANSDLRVVA